VKVGDSVKQGDTVVVISTDKVDMEGQVIARMTNETRSAEAPAAPRAQASDEARASSQERAFDDEPATSVQDGQAAQTSQTGLAQAETGIVSPIARRIAAQQGIDLSKVEGSARGGRITKADVLAAAGDGDGGKTAPPSSPGASAPPEGPAQVAEPDGSSRAAAAPERPAGAQPLRGGAAALARYMDESRSIPTATSFRTFPVTGLEQRRAQLKDAGQAVSFTHLIAYAIALAATEDMPVMATHFAEIDGKPHRVDDGACHLGLAVDVEKKDGSRTLMVPVIRDAGRMSFGEFIAAYNALVEKARTNALTAAELTGANVTLTNPGGIGTVASVPRLMAGQGAIVATGTIG
jgi:2-oxoglutarate dehydrogenase E1 component